MRNPSENMRNPATPRRHPCTIEHRDAATRQPPQTRRLRNATGRQAARQFDTPPDSPERMETAGDPLTAQI